MNIRVYVTALIVLIGAVLNSDLASMRDEDAGATLSNSILINASQPRPTTDCGPAWSPIGEQLAFHSDRDGRWAIYLIDMKGQAARRILADTVTAREPSWSPDGKQVAIARGAAGMRQIFVVNADGTDLRRVTNGLGNAGWPAWSRDGQSILYDLDIQGNKDIYRISVSGGDPVRLTTDTTSETLAKWGANDSLITFNSRRDGRWKVVTMRPDGSGQLTLTDGGVPTFSRSGARILYQGAPVPGATNFFIMNGDGTEKRQLTMGFHADNSAAFGPNDDSIVFCSNRAGAYQLYRMRLDGSAIERISEGRHDGHSSSH